jgi:hypothetical protein
MWLMDGLINACMNRFNKLLNALQLANMAK